MRMRKFISVLAALAMILSLSTTAFADETPVSEDESVVEVVVMVEPLDLKATVTLSSYFQINPNAEEGEMFVSPVLTASNQTPAPLRFSIVSMAPADGNSPALVAPDRFSDWTNLGKSDTKANIALGFKNPASDPTLPSSLVEGAPAWSGLWLDETTPETALFDVERNASRNFEMQAKFGRAWDSAYSFKYNCVMKVSLT